MDDQKEGWEGFATILPVVHDPAYCDAIDGGLHIFSPEDQDDPAFSVVWCYWPEPEDKVRLAKIHEHVAMEARTGWIRQQRGKQSNESSGED